MDNYKEIGMNALEGLSHTLQTFVKEHKINIAGYHTPDGIKYDLRDLLYARGLTLDELEEYLYSLDIIFNTITV